MNYLNIDFPVSVFSVGAFIFLSAPLEIFSSYTIKEISMTGLLIELVGIIIGALVIYRNKVTQECLEDI